MNALPSFVQPTQRDESYERGFLLGRAAIIRAVRDGINSGYSVTDVLEQLEELEHVKFTR